jgi:hypothetical protein
MQDKGKTVLPGRGDGSGAGWLLLLVADMLAHVGLGRQCPNLRHLEYDVVRWSRFSKVDTTRLLPFEAQHDDAQDVEAHNDHFECDGYRQTEQESPEEQHFTVYGARARTGESLANR